MASNSDTAVTKIRESVRGLKLRYSRNNFCNIQNKLDNHNVLIGVCAYGVQPGCLCIKKSRSRNSLCIFWRALGMPDPKCMLIGRSKRPPRLRGLSATRSLTFLFENSPDQVQGSWITYNMILMEMTRRVVTPGGTKR